jgi:hypothetical protein
VNPDLVKVLILGGLAFIAFGFLATMHIWIVPKSALPKRRKKSDPTAQVPAPPGES